MKEVKRMCQRCNVKEAQTYFRNTWLCHSCIMFIKLGGLNNE